MTVRNLADTGTHHDRFNDGKFKIEFGGWSLVVDGNVDEQGANVSWEHAVDVESGDVIARPTMLAASCSHAPYAALGFEPRRIGSLGPLVQIFPPAMDELRREYALPNFYGRMDDVHRDLALIAALCKEAAST